MRTCALIAIERRPAALEAAVLFLPHRKKLPTNRIICSVAKLSSASAMAQDSDKDKDKDKDPKKKCISPKKPHKDKHCDDDNVTTIAMAVVSTATATTDLELGRFLTLVAGLKSSTQLFRPSPGLDH